MEFFLLIITIVLQADAQAGVEVSHFAQVTRDGFILENDFLEDCGIRRKGCFGPADFRRTAILDLALRRSALVTLVVDSPVLAHLDFKTRTQCVNDGGADAMQSAGYLVGTAIKLSAGMQ